ncbi:MAG: glutamine amidotransferase [Desulfofustis sp.]
MSVGDMEQSLSRGEKATDLLYGEDGLIEQLQKNFTLRIFAFDRTTRPIAEPGDLSFTGSKTHMAGAMQHLAEALQGLPFEALVLVTDGIDNSSEDPLHMARIINAGKTPVHLIGIGADRAAKDIEISQVSTSGSVMEGGIFEVQVTVQSRGYTGQESDLLIEVGEDIVSAKKIKLGPDNMLQRYSFYLTPLQEGALAYSARIPLQEDETVKENNILPFLVENPSKEVEILYIEGHPRNEYKFIRRAAETDSAVRLKTYLMTGPQKFLRQGIDSTMELASGYPDSEDALFKYDAVIFGDLTRTLFTDEQLALTRDFVSRRGGGFLMLGGSTAFDPGFIGTPIEGLLPVSLVNEKDLPPALRGGVGKGDHPTGQTFAPRLTTEGQRSMILRLEIEDEINRKLWRNMPQLQGINVSGRAKPGAAVLAVHPTLTFQGEPLPVLAYQRYGRGRTMSLMTATTWRWQMLKPHEDTSHERFWRQVLRWLTASVPAPVEISLEGNKFSTGDEVKVKARVYDEVYEPVSDATVWLKLTDPDGAIEDIRMLADIDRAGDYIASFSAAKSGVHHLEVSSSGGLSEDGYASLSFLAANSMHEMRGAAVMNRDLMEKIAQVGGGNYYTPEKADLLVKDLNNNRKVHTVTYKLDIWNIPIVFFLLFFCFGLEWLLRRRTGLS